MIYKLRLDNLLELRKLPETGMGYQVIDGKVMNSYKSRRLLVLNAFIAIELGRTDLEAAFKTIFSTDPDRLYSKTPELILSDITLRKSDDDRMNLASESDFTKPIGALEAHEESANGDELFTRLSAFPHDIRIDKINRCLVPGSFATTVSDVLKCKLEKADPVDRYALPNGFPIGWLYYIEPQATDSLRRGQTEPAFGKPGGGREVYFEKGTGGSTFIAQSSWDDAYAEITP